MVKLFKYHLKRVVENSSFIFELNTFIIEVEDILYCRFITSLSSDSNDMVVFTRDYYMIGNL